MNVSYLLCLIFLLQKSALGHRDLHAPGHHHIRVSKHSLLHCAQPARTSGIKCCRSGKIPLSAPLNRIQKSANYQYFVDIIFFSIFFKYHLLFSLFIMYYYLVLYVSVEGNEFLIRKTQPNYPFVF